MKAPYYLLFFVLLFGTVRANDTVYVQNDVEKAILLSKQGKFIKFTFIAQPLKTELPQAFLAIVPSQLVSFTWDNCTASTLPNEFSKFTNLQFIYLGWFLNDETAMKNLPACIYELVQLKYLIVEGMSFKTIDDKINKLKNLEVLYVSNTFINTISLDGNKLNKLVELNLSCNKLMEEFPISILTITSLKKLDFGGGACGGTPLKSLPENINELNKLEKISLDYAKLDKLPDNFCQLINLKHVSLFYSGIKNLPKNVGQLKNLRRLSIACGNEFMALPESFFTLNLQKFSFDVYKPNASLIAQKNRLVTWAKKIKGSVTFR